MNTITIVLTAVALAMDAFAVSVAKGVCVKDRLIRHMLLFGLFFGAFQAIMPIIGWLVAQTLLAPFMEWAKYIAFGTLVLIGGHMIYGALKPNPEKDSPSPVSIRLGELAALAVATSIDALAVGVGFGLMGVPIASASATIGVTAFLFSFCGVYIGSKIGAMFEKGSGVLGGSVLMLIGVTMLF